MNKRYAAAIFINRKYSGAAKTAGWRFGDADDFLGQGEA